MVYLSGYVVECSLKALFLSQIPGKQHDEIVDWFRAEVKHNLERLRVELLKQGVIVPKDQLQHIKRVRSNWYSEMRYKTHAWSRDEAEKVCLAAERILEWSTGSQSWRKLRRRCRIRSRARFSAL